MRYPHSEEHYEKTDFRVDVEQLKVLGLRGPDAVNKILEDNKEKFDQLDDYRAIDSAFTITRVPEGDEPFEARNEWRGVTFPRRAACDLNLDEFYVAVIDVVLSLIAHNRMYAVEWCIGDNTRIPNSGTDIFQVSDGKFFEPEFQSMSSLNYYRNFVPRAILKHVK